MNWGWISNVRHHARALLVLAAVVLAGVLTLVGVSRNGSTVKVTSASADSRFAVSSNATDSQYGVTATVAVNTQTTTTTTTTTPVTETTPITKTTGNTTTTPTTKTSSGVTVTTSVPAVVNPTPVVAATCTAVGNAGGLTEATEQKARSSQTDQAFIFNRNASGDIGFFADNRQVVDDISSSGTSATGSTATPAACGQKVFGGNSTVVKGGYQWNTPDAGGQFVSVTKFWPVDAWGRWGYELICRKQTTCHDTTQAFAADPSKLDQLEPVTHKATFTIAPGHLALVHMTLNHLGGQLVTDDSGELSGTIKASTMPVATKVPVTGQRTFTIYYVRCAVWGKPNAATKSLEHTFPRSNIGKLYGMKDLDTSSCSTF